MAKKVVVDHEKCQLSGACMRVCPEKAISTKEGKLVIDSAKCDLDGWCIAACPHGALSYQEESG